MCVLRVLRACPNPKRHVAACAAGAVCAAREPSCAAQTLRHRVPRAACVPQGRAPTRLRKPSCAVFRPAVPPNWCGWQMIIGRLCAGCACRHVCWRTVGPAPRLAARRRAVPVAARGPRRRGQLGQLAVRPPSRSIPPPWGSIRFRLAPRTHTPCGCIVRVVPDRQKKSRKTPTRNVSPLFFVSTPKCFTVIFLALRYFAGVGSDPKQVRVASRSISPPWRSIRFRLALRTYAPRGVRVVSQTKSRKIPTRKILPLFFVRSATSGPSARASSTTPTPPT